MFVGSRRFAACVVLMALLAHAEFAQSIADIECSALFEGVNFVNPDNCRSYFTCYKGSLMENFCPSGFYNPSTENCDVAFKCNPDSLKDPTTSGLMTTEAFSTPEAEISTISSSTVKEVTLDLETTVYEEESGSGGWQSSSHAGFQSTQIVTETVPEAVTQDVTEEVTKDVTEIVSGGVSKEVTEWVTEEVTKEITEEVTDQVTQSTTTERTTQTVTDEVSDVMPEVTSPPEVQTTTTEPPIPTTTTTTTTAEPPTTTTTAEPPTTTTTTTLSPPQTTPPSNGICPIPDSDDLLFVPHSNDCEKYFLCYHQKPIELSCISGLHWNQKKKLCDYPKEVQCVAEPDASPFPKCSMKGIYSMPHPKRCDFFIMCMNGDQTVQQCDSFHKWDVIEEQCVIKDRATCILDLNKPQVAGHGHLSLAL